MGHDDDTLEVEVCWAASASRGGICGLGESKPLAQYPLISGMGSCDRTAEEGGGEQLHSDRFDRERIGQSRESSSE
jgi:hypothetical protein